MSDHDPRDRGRYPVRKLHLTDAAANDDDLSATTTPAERLEMMWTLVEDHLAFIGHALDESRLQRHVVHVHRRAR